jgi:DNA-binding response OmpR family regulator
MRLRLHLALGSGKAPAEEVLQVADLLVRPGVRQVRRGQRTVELTSREYQLLLLLLRQGGRVVSRKRILQEIWADQGGGSSNVIEVYVRYLRQKLEAGGERRLLHTVRGQGYCLSERMPPREGQA